jgi:hypothetical protein
MLRFGLIFEVPGVGDGAMWVDKAIYVGPQIGMNPKLILGLPDLETDSGSPRSDMGIAFLVFFFSHAQDRPFLTKN